MQQNIKRMDRFYIDDMPVPSSMAEWQELLEKGDIKEKTMIQRDDAVSTGLLIRDMLKKAGRSKMWVDKQLGWSINTTSGMTRRNDALFSNLVKIARVCNFEIHFVYKGDRRDYD